MRYFLIVCILIVLGSCSVQNRFVVTELGFELPEAKSSEIYFLPRNTLKVNIQLQKEVFIPGPYADYALKLLGINGVQKIRTEHHSIKNVKIDEFTEADPDQFYTVNLLEGVFNKDAFLELIDQGYIRQKNLLSSVEYGNYQRSSKNADLAFKDVTMEPNQEIKRETIYKTVLTDTSFLRVPVTTEQMERKTIEKKAEEAANLILEIRSDRYYISAGLLDPYPVDFDVETALKNLDKLEKDYLSLFIGKSYTEEYQKEFHIIPEGDVNEEIFVLVRFSEIQGIGQDGDLLKLIVTPASNAESLRNLMPQSPETDSENRIYYRVPGKCDASILLGETEIYTMRMDLFQSGALVNVIVNQ